MTKNIKTKYRLLEKYIISYSISCHCLRLVVFWRRASCKQSDRCMEFWKIFRHQSSEHLCTFILFQSDTNEWQNNCSFIYERLWGTEQHGGLFRACWSQSDSNLFKERGNFNISDIPHGDALHPSGQTDTGYLSRGI